MTLRGAEETLLLGSLFCHVCRLQMEGGGGRVAKAPPYLLLARIDGKF